MSDQGQASADSVNDVEAWDPRRMLRSVTSLEARLSSGFLRCHPEKWFPGFASRWAPMISSIGCDLRVGEIKPTIVLPDSQTVCFKVLLAGEPAVIALDPQSARAISQEIAPIGDRSRNSTVLLEYFVQRFLACLGMCQAGLDLSSVTFCGRCVPTEVEISASVRFSLSVNSSPIVIMVGLGLKMVEVMDGLWRRQIHSSNRTAQGPGVVRIEVAQLGVPPQMLSEYLSKGTIIDLEVPVSDSVTLRLGHKPFMPARLVSVDGVLGCQIVQGSITNLAVPEGTSRLSIELGTASVEAMRLTELGQVGSVLTLSSPPGSTVSLVINQEVVATALLCVYQGRFAVEVV